MKTKKIEGPNEAVVKCRKTKTILSSSKRSFPSCVRSTRASLWLTKQVLSCFCYFPTSVLPILLSFTVCLLHVTKLQYNHFLIRITTVSSSGCGQNSPIHNSDEFYLRHRNIPTESPSLLHQQYNIHGKVSHSAPKIFVRPFEKWR